MRTKTYRADVKALDGADEGTFEALVSVFGNVDFAGDRVVKGAFQKSLDTWSESGDPIPVVFSHRWDDLDAHIGKVLEAKETDEGLWVKAQLDLDDPSAAKVHRMLKDRRIREFSFAYDVIDEAKADGANELRELEVIEVGPTLKGMNPATQLLTAKTLDLFGNDADPEVFEKWIEQLKQTQSAVHGGPITPIKAGRVLSTKNESKLRQASDLLAEVLAGVESTSDDEAAKSNAKPEDPPGGKGEEPTVRSPADMCVVLNAELVDAEAA